MDESINKNAKIDNQKEICRKSYNEIDDKDKIHSKFNITHITPKFLNLTKLNSPFNLKLLISSLNPTFNPPVKRHNP